MYPVHKPLSVLHVALKEDKSFDGSGGRIKLHAQTELVPHRLNTVQPNNYKPPPLANQGC